jgi:hypothetical protein
MLAGQEPLESVMNLRTVAAGRDPAEPAKRRTAQARRTIIIRGNMVFGFEIVNVNN